MTISAEMYAPTAADADALWAVVGDPWRLPAWLDVDEVTSVDPEPVEVGSEIVAVSNGALQTWHVLTVRHKLLELTTDTPDGRFSLGYRVVAQKPGCRLVMAAGLEPTRKVGGMRARMVELPALRKRLDRWATRAIHAAEGRPPT